MEIITNLLQDPQKRRYSLLIAITLMTIPCYCAGWTAIQRAPSRFAPTQTFTIDPRSETPDFSTPFTSPQSPTITLTPTITNTEFVPPSYTPSITPEITITQDFTPFILDTETPTLTLTPIPTDTPTQTQPPTSTETQAPPTPSATDNGG